jgi:DNA-binding LacI/PurR family transcriptional regulator
MAIGAIMALRDAGLAVPQDMAVVGFDNIAQAGYITPSLTTVSYPKYEMGMTAAEILFRRIRQGVPRMGQRHFVPCQLLVREST